MESFKFGFTYGFSLAFLCKILVKLNKLNDGYVDGRNPFFEKSFEK